MLNILPRLLILVFCISLAGCTSSNLTAVGTHSDNLDIKHHVSCKATDSNLLHGKRQFYRCQLRIPQEFTSHSILSSSISVLSTWINDRLKDQLIRQYITDRNQKLNVRKMPSIFKSPYIYQITFPKIDETERMIFQAFITGCIFIVGIYHLFVFIYYRKNQSVLLLSIICYIITFRMLLLQNTLFAQWLTELSQELIVTFDYLANVMTLLFFYLFVRKEMKMKSIKHFHISFVIVIFTYSLFILLAPSFIIVNSFFFLQILTILVIGLLISFSIYGVKQKITGASSHLVACIVLILAVVIDLFSWMNKSSLVIEEFASFGLLFYLFMQSILLGRSANQTTQEKQLSKALDQRKPIVESQIAKQTEKFRGKKEQKITHYDVLSSVTHELNTPLTFIQGYTKAMLDNVVPRNDSSYLRAIYNDTQMMAHLVKDLQELSLLESGQTTFLYQDVDMRSFMRQVYDSQKSAFPDKNVQIYYTESSLFSTDEKIICSIDPIRIRQVLNNLIMNALKFTPDAGTITIKLEVLSTEHHRNVKISIKDTGIGMATEDIPFIFNRFYKIDQQNKDTHKGVGLGLAICKQIIEFHQGKIGVRSQLGIGSIFYFTLPVKGENEDEKEKGTSS